MALTQEQITERREKYGLENIAGKQDSLTLNKTAEQRIAELRAGMPVEKPTAISLVGLGIVSALFSCFVVYQAIKISSKKSIKMPLSEKHWWYRLLKVLYLGLYVLIAFSSFAALIANVADSGTSTLAFEIYFSILIGGILILELVKYIFIYTIAGKQS